MDKATLQAHDPAMHDHVSGNGGFGITPEFLARIPKAHAEMIKGAGGITMGHLMQLLQIGAPQNSATEIAKSAYIRHSQDLQKMGIDYGVTVDKQGNVNIPDSILKKASDNVEEAKRQELLRAAGGVEGLRSRALYAHYGAQINSPAWNQLNAIPGMGTP